MPDQSLQTESRAAHTPGPWIARRGMVVRADDTTDGTAECWRHVDGGTLCPTLDEAEANARLIAAAEGRS
jgi:hypothetical protein